MKDHLEINRSVMGKSTMDYPRKPELLNSKIYVSNKNEGLKTGEVDYYNEAVIKEMDFSKAIEYSKYITSQSLIPEGRQMMSFAHNYITPRQVSRMF
jgi:hypothetical protein